MSEKYKLTLKCTLCNKALTVPTITFANTVLLCENCYKFFRNVLEELVYCNCGRRMIKIQSNPTLKYKCIECNRIIEIIEVKSE